MSRAETISVKDRKMYFDFVEDHYMNVKAAIAAGLPTSCWKENQDVKNVLYLSIPWFHFVCWVYFLANLNIEMMMAYTDGDIAHVIKT